MNTRGELAAADPLIPRWRQGGRREAGGGQAGGRRAAAGVRRKGAISAPETSPTKLRAGSQLLTKTSWDSGRLTSTRRVAARDHLPRRDTQHAWDVDSGWVGGGDKMHRTWGDCAGQAPGRLSCSDLGRAQATGPTESVPLWST